LAGASIRNVIGKKERGNPMKASKIMLISALSLAFSTCAGLILGSLLWRAWRSGLVAKVVILALILLRHSAPAPPKRLFKEHILDPIPKSVKEIKVDRAREFSGYGYVFHFKISGEDLDRIVESRPFERMFISYEYGNLYFGNTGLSVYPPGEEPAWFIGWELRGSEGYAYEEVKGGKSYTWVLIFNQELEEAYFFSYKGDAPPSPPWSELLPENDAH
jgi:hypothetical protein